MYKPMTQQEIDRLVARARAERSGALGRMIVRLFSR